MSNTDYERRLRAVMDGLAESYAEASDEDLLQEARDAGVDIEMSAERLKATMLDIVARHKRFRLAEARSPTCPVCDGQAISRQGKLICTRCHRVAENCCGD